MAAETKIRRGVQAPQHRRTSNHAAQAALAIAAPPRLPPSPPQALPYRATAMVSLSPPLPLSLSCPLFLPYRAMEMARKLLSRLENPAFWPQYSILDFLGVFLVFCSFGTFLIAHSALLNSLG